MHSRKNKFPSQRKYKLQARGDDPFQVLECINDNAYKIDLPLDYGMSSTFNVSDLSFCDEGTIDSNLRMNSFQGGNDEGLQRDEELSLGGVVTRSRLKKLKKNINMKMNSLMEKEEKGDRKIINCSELFD